MKWTSWVTLIGLGGIIALVIASSLRVGRVRCEVCIEFRGKRACRAVDGENEMQARTSAINNTCALLASGVTDSMACERTPPSSLDCQ
jgi:hypothetical protein